MTLQVKSRFHAQQACVTGTPSMTRVSGPSLQTSPAPAAVHIASAAISAQPSTRFTVTLVWTVLSCQPSPVMGLGKRAISLRFCEQTYSVA